MGTGPLLAASGGATAPTKDRAAAERREDPYAAPAPKLVASSYRRRDYYLRRILALGDILAITLALTTALVLTDVTLGPHIWLGLLTLPAWLLLFKCYRLYERDAERIALSTIDDIPGLFHSVLLGAVITWLYFQAAPSTKLTFTTLMLFSSLVLVFSLLARLAVRSAARHLFTPERAVLIGAGPETTRLLMESVHGDRRCHVEIVGRLISPEQISEGGPPVLGQLDGAGIGRTLAEHRVGRVLVDNSELGQRRLTELIKECKPLGVKVSLLPAGSSVIGPSVEVEDIRGLTVFGINPPVLSRSSRWAKRGLDILGSAIALALFAPIIAMLALLVRLDSSGPAFFRQERIGQNGRRFTLLKLRTMAKNAERRRSELIALSKDRGWLHLDHDPRITRIGRVLRLTSLDELPQLWNVLRGDMSLVGPRPLVPEEDEMVAGWARGRLDLTPGITGLWQVLGRTSIPFEEMVKLDYLYVTNWSLWGDLRLILRTLPVVLRRNGAN